MSARWRSAERPDSGPTEPVRLTVRPGGAARIQTLGGFSVWRGEHVVKACEWQSRRARELLKLLVARRGRPTTRGYLMETLWPGDEPERLANRLSVALTTVRGVLDPERRFSTDSFVRSDSDCVAINKDAVDVDLDRFLAATADGLRHIRCGEPDRGLPILEAATLGYRGDFLEENPYDDWAVPAREEARAGYVAAARTLAVNAAASSDPDAAMPFFLRILETDRYDEQAWLGLVAALTDAGRHGEAQRHYAGYRRAMQDLEVEPAAFPRGRRTATAPPARLASALATALS